MMQKKMLVISCWLILLAVVLAAGCTASPGPAPDQKSDQKAKAVPAAKPAPSRAGSTPAGSITAAPAALPAAGIPAAPLLGRPTDHSVNVNVLPSENLDIFLQYRNATGPAVLKTTPVPAQAGVPLNIVLSGLARDTAYQYEVCWRRAGDTADTCSREYTFHTQRVPGSSFVFVIQADSHLDERTRGALYNQTLARELSEQPDFLIDLGDTSMTEKLPDKSEAAIRSRYLLQRSYLGAPGSSVPLFLVLGNHDGESGWAAGGKDGSLARLSLQFRKLYFPNPEPDGFYSGNAAPDAAMGALQDYYAWQWGDAMFIVLDPFWYTTTKPGGNTDPWSWTLGKDQYQWLERTLENDTAKYTFVFSHHLAGGDVQGRGGIEAASLYEWGGNNADGTYGFSQHRPGWDMPVHRLIAAHNVTAFFHGHDHLFAYQQLDGIVYQEVPQPATPGAPDPGTEYGYTEGVILPGPGHLRITVSPDAATVGYIGTALAGTDRNTPADGSVVYSYTLHPRQGA